MKLGATSLLPAISLAVGGRRPCCSATARHGPVESTSQRVSAPACYSQAKHSASASAARTGAAEQNASKEEES